MDKVTFIDNIKKCYTLLQENHVIKKAIEDLYNKGDITQNDITQIYNTLRTIEDVIVNDSEINIGNGYRIYSTQEDGVYLYRGEQQILHLNYNYYPEDNFNYYDIYIGNSESGNVNISFNDEENLFDVIMNDSEGNSNVFELTMEDFRTNNITTQNLSLGYDSKPTIEYNSEEANIYDGVLYKDTNGGNVLLQGRIVNADVFYLMKLLGKFYTYDGENTTHYTLYYSTEYYRKLLFIGYFIDQQENLGQRIVTIDTQTRAISFEDR